MHVSVFASGKTDILSDTESLLPPVQDWSGKSEAFAASQRQRLMWFYEQTPFYDEAYLLYPVARIPRAD